ncbi:putative zinc-binding protein [Kingella negevensis]|uniref:putative zinc-binding protein n=1 Tax=Kingella negevensis TaxID=1522312 RepID=UPI0025504366|nr:putative zinc-binding protein [Kingella negevensis]MDK4679512.1 putative zinc-binding protein [Kingella negevensis]MDK4682770.1 putative zinc-binding protein [Kingella negevensis]MDK4690967.1 putative zinc-binding protein [Kingella negevensis]MDK4693886.1 putative zinc-binding protein [Kingella negevensis]MDK4700208.1 putative zinc-binding protein [Kingella negevensis]
MNECSTRPLIYSCSGCSDVAQLANDTAVALDHADEFEMSCISGVGGKVPTLVKKAQSGRPMLMIDSCIAPNRVWKM